MQVLQFYDLYLNVKLKNEKLFTERETLTKKPVFINTISVCINFVSK